MSYEDMARRHWTKYLPEKTAALKKAGIFEEVITEEAESARKEIAIIVSDGAPLFAAEEIVLPEYILLPPEDGYRDEDDDSEEANSIDHDMLKPICPWCKERVRVVEDGALTTIYCANDECPIRPEVRDHVCSEELTLRWNSWAE